MRLFPYRDLTAQKKKLLDLDLGLYILGIIATVKQEDNYLYFGSQGGFHGNV